MGQAVATKEVRVNTSILLITLFSRVTLLVLAFGILLAACHSPAPSTHTPPAKLKDTAVPTATQAPSPTNRPTPKATSQPTSAKPPTRTSIPASSTPTLPALQYVFPVQPPEVADYLRGHHDYPAADIWAPAGSSFVAVTNGVVDFVGAEDLWNSSEDDPASRGGLSVAILGDDGVRYYGSHLSAIAPGIQPGVRVVAGQILGQVGNSGNARHIAPVLHFGISHPTSPEDWVVRRGEIDPFPYLETWEAGKPLTPKLPEN
jgi:murein DD-endopeptidase MepM/ murein hydrolase activator NlpD